MPASGRELPQAHYKPEVDSDYSKRKSHVTRAALVTLTYEYCSKQCNH